jgi:hypothetical protein
VPLVIVLVAVRPGPFPIYWNGPAFRDLAGWSGSVGVAAWLVRRVSARWAPHLLLGVASLYLLGGVGISQGSATLLFVASSYVVGRLVIGLLFRADPARLLARNSLAIGVAIQLAGFGLLIHFPGNTRGNYLAILGLPLLAAALLGSRSRSLAQALVASATRQAHRLGEVPLPQVAVVVTVVGYVARFAFFPSVGYDDNALHLRMWSVLSAQGIYAFDTVMSVGAVTPFALDLLASIVSMVAGADSRGAVSLTLLALLLIQLWQLGAYVVRGGLDRSILVVLFVSTPMLANLLTLQQVELLMALLATTGVLLAVERRPAQSTGRPAAVLALAALCAATKLPGAVLGALLVVAATGSAWRDRGHRRGLGSVRSPLPGLLWLLPVLAFTALQSYLVAWRLTGNPVFPFYNAFFKSPLFPQTNLADLRYATGFTFSSVWDTFFRTSAHAEAADFTAGFQYLLVLPLGLGLLASRRFRAIRWPLLLTLLGFGLVMFWASQYWRYLFPVLPLATVTMGAVLLGAPGQWSQAHLTLRRALLLGFAALNLYFLPGISWFFTVPPQRSYTEAGRAAVTARLAPERSLTEEVNRRYPGTRVLYDSEIPAGATLVGTPIYVNWYSPSRQTRYQAWRNLSDVEEFIQAERVDLVIWDQDPADTGGPRGLLLQYLSHHAYPELQVGSKLLYRSLDRGPAYRIVYPPAPAPSLPGDPAGSAAGQSGAGPSFVANSAPRVVGAVEIGRASVARYSATIRCPGGPGRFIAQVNWDMGRPYYRAVACGQEPVQFTEAFPIPVGARSGQIFVTARETPEALVSGLLIETDQGLRP